MENHIEKRINETIKYLTREYVFRKEFKFSDEHSGLMKDANALDSPIMVIAPEGDAYDLRVWVYGGRIATINMTNGAIKISVDRKITSSQRDRKENEELLRFVEEDNNSNIKNPFDYGKYLYDGFTNGNGCQYSLNDFLKVKHKTEKDPLNAYRRFSKLVKSNKTNYEYIDEELLDLMVFATYRRWLNSKSGSAEPEYAGEKLMQCIIAKNSMMNSVFNPGGDSMVVVDVEYCFLEGSSKRADFAVFDGKSFGLVEFKYLGQSMKGKNSLKNHHNHFDEALQNYSKRKAIIDELIKKTEILCKYNIIDNSWKKAIDEYKKYQNKQELWSGFYFLGDGKDINDNSKDSDVMHQIKDQLKPTYQNRTPAKCKISKVGRNGDIDDISAGWVNIVDIIKPLIGFAL